MRKYPTKGHGVTPQSIGEGPFEDAIVETAGYMTARQQIQRIQAAGVLLQDWRNSHYPPDGEIPDEFTPPGYAPEYFDIVEESRAIVAGKTAAAARIERAAKKAAEEAEPPVEPEPPAEPAA